MMFPTPSPSGVPRKGITTPFIANDVLYGSGLQFAPPEENPKPLEDMEEGRSMKGERPEGKGKERQFADVPKV
jgi:hypothetical protein